MRRLPLRSPPRMRGKAKNRCRSCPLTRITPACAGKRAASLAEITSLWDHPRVCGEKRCGENLLNIAPGSPPRMRGKGPDDRAHPLVPGITPAYAGKSNYHLPDHLPGGDHPRVCGEKCSFSLHGSPWSGSPPRVRGKEVVLVDFICLRGITPAYAGKSVHRSGLHRTEGDHPRVCGEKIYPLLAIASPLGSPPRVRGKG